MHACSKNVVEEHDTTQKLLACTSLLLVIKFTIFYALTFLALMLIPSYK